ncbi:MAG: hypothetical protein R2737_14790 [Candidatus Nanopelagicales bacterium]
MTVAATLLAATPAQAAQRVDPGFLGIHVPGVQGGLWPTVGVGSVRLWDTDTAWAQVERRPGRYDWRALDSAVATARRNRASILLVLGPTPTWAASRKAPGYDYPVPGAASPPRNVTWWDRYVTKVVTRYKGRIQAYQVWNEASLLNFWNGTPAQMADLTARAYKIVKKIDPKAKVVGASTTTRLVGSYQRFFPPYLRALRSRGWPVDVFAGHFYPPGTGDPADRAALIQLVQRELRRAGAPKRPLWDTESNFGLAGPGTVPYRSITGAKAAAWTGAAYMDSLRLGVSRTYWYAWTSGPYDLLGVQAYPGTPAAKAMGTLDRWLRGARVQRCSSRGAVRACDVVKSGRRATIMWTSGSRVVVAAPAGTKKRCTVRRWCRATKPGASVRLTTSPVWFGR